MPRLLKEVKMKVGDTVTWKSQAGSYEKEKTGEIVAVIPAGKYVAEVYPPIRDRSSEWGGGYSRRHESYVVKVGTKLYWPLVARLRLVSDVSKEQALIAKTRQETAREIFREIEAIRKETLYGNVYIFLDGNYESLKSRYLEGK